MTEKYERAEQDYMTGMKYKDIATKYGVTLNTVKTWKQRHKWQRDNLKNVAPPKPKGVHTKAKKGAHKPAPKIIDELEANSELTDKQKLFCLFYLQRFNATWAYQQAYKCSYEVAVTNGPRLLRNARIKEQLQELKKQQSQELYVDANDILKCYLKQATADVTDVVEFETVKHLRWQKNYSKDGKYGPKSNPYDYVPAIDPDTGEQAFYFEQVVKLRDSKKIDTSNIKSIRIDKGEAVVEMYDKQKAMKELLERLPATDDLNKHKIRKLKADADIAEIQAKTAKQGNALPELTIVDSWEQDYGGDDT
ncbi:terminase [Lactiplantibacillus plantarum]|uniref:terminase small subunit n=1 Tax=Lactiplantibacillus plantarum TaxID=1590 RepID=UPI000FFE147F|nr:terminase small subunit [Lactiplantibacillus plantarum]QAT29223.1 terminase [Lactiplantibacillus plantarum]QAT34045.1 terminase [Lactiplantibacillus plantarum]